MSTCKLYMLHIQQRAIEKSANSHHGRKDQLHSSSFSLFLSFFYSLSYMLFKNSLFLSLHCLPVSYICPIQQQATWKEGCQHAPWALFNSFFKTSLLLSFSVYLPVISLHIQQRQSEGRLTRTGARINLFFTPFTLFLSFNTFFQNLTFAYL